MTKPLAIIDNHDDFGVYHIQLVSHSMDDPDVYEPTLANFIAGKPFKVDCYIEKIANDKLPTADATDEEQAKFLYSVFEQKVGHLLFKRVFSPTFALICFQIVSGRIDGDTPRIQMLSPVDSSREEALHLAHGAFHPSELLCVRLHGGIDRKSVV